MEKASIITLSLRTMPEARAESAGKREHRGWRVICERMCG